MKSILTNEEILRDMAQRYGIDVQRYIPVKVENSTFFALYCIDKFESAVEGRDWITKVDILPADQEQLSKDLGISKFDFAINEKYTIIDNHEGNTID